MALATWHRRICIIQICSLITLSDEPRFVLENSGVAEPQNLRDKFNDALASGHPLMSRIRLDTMVTMVDSGSFFADWSSKAPLAARQIWARAGTCAPLWTSWSSKSSTNCCLLLPAISCCPHTRHALQKG